MKPRRYLTPVQTVNVGNWLVENQEFVRQYLIENGMETKNMRKFNFHNFLKEAQIEQASSLFIRPDTNSEPSCVDPDMFNSVLAELERDQSQNECPQNEGDLRDELLKHLTKEGENS